MTGACCCHLGFLFYVGFARRVALAEQGYDLLVDLLSAEPLVMLNAAFCQQHRARCPPSEQLLRECAYVST